MTDEFTRTFENHWNDFRARWCDSTDLGGARAYSHDEVKAVMFHRVARVDVPAERVDRLIDDAVEFFREKEYDCLFTLSPLDRPADMAERLRQRGFELALLPVAMLCDQPAGPVSAEDVEMEVAGAVDYDTWAEIMCTCFGNPPEAGEAGRSVLDFPEVLLYLALRKGEPAGTALLYSRNGIGYIDAVGTLPEHRGCGVASAVAARAVADSKALGNRWTTLEVECESPAERIYRRLGFRRMHFRPRYAKALEDLQ